MHRVPDENPPPLRWCCAEFSSALKNGRIVNLSDPLVQEVLQTRNWPNTVDDYAAMMDENAVRRVHFTNKGDAAAVLYNFFKMTLGLRLKHVGWRGKLSLTRAQAQLPGPTLLPTATPNSLENADLSC